MAPGPVKTDLYPAGFEEQMIAPDLAQTRAANRVGTPADIADAVLMLVNEKARWITGQNISVNGGITR